MGRMWMLNIKEVKGWKAKEDKEAKVCCSDYSKTRTKRKNNNTSKYCWETGKS